MPAFVSNAAAWAARSSVAAGMASLLEAYDSQDPRWLRVLTYHRVDEHGARPELFDGVISATPKQFQEQMRFLQAWYRVVSIDEVLAAFRSGSPLPARAVLISFDDGYRDLQEHAWPILKELGLPAIVFVPTAFPDAQDQAFWWDRIHQTIARSDATFLTTPIGELPIQDAAAKRLATRRLAKHIKALPHEQAMSLVNAVCETTKVAAPHYVLTWNELRGLAAEGLAVGPHTRTHPRLTQVSAAIAREEIEGSWQTLRQQIPSAVPVLAYPDGACNDEVAATARACGMELAFTTQRGLNYLPSADRWRLRRINVGQRSSVGALRFQLLSLSRHLASA